MVIMEIRLRYQKGNIFVIEECQLVACLKKGQNVLGPGNFHRESRVELRNVKSYALSFSYTSKTSEINGSKNKRRTTYFAIVL